LHESCGVFGVYAQGDDVARLAFFGIYALQHRGQESSGIAASDGKRIRLHAEMGLVAQVFNEGRLDQLRGGIAIGHNRYSTTGSSRIYNVQPVLVSGPFGDLALGHNGNIVNASYLRLGRLKGAYSLVILTRDKLLGVRDPFGVRPLSIGSLNGGWVLASETCALDHLGSDFLREVDPGEIVLIDQAGVNSFSVGQAERRALCIFEFIYFARPDSLIGGRRLYPARQDMGMQLSYEHPVDADLVIGVPDSATAAGLGYSIASGIPFSEGLLKNRYVGRTFIEPEQRLRDLGVKLKFNPLTEVLSGKRLIVVDDSIVRGTTTPQVISLLRRAGATEIHLRICAPPIRYPCFFGVDMATRRELIAAQKTIPEIAESVGADSLGYLSTDGLIKAVDLPGSNFCLACFTGEYPLPVQLEMDKLALEDIADAERVALDSK
jgi:amidophosphoribosyltransferase